MSKQLEELARCEQITEWLSPWDERLTKVTGLQPPVDGGSLREEWHVERSETPKLLQLVKRILVPKPLTDRVEAKFAASSWGADEWSGTVSLEFAEHTDWSQCLPVSDKTLVFDRRGARGNASIALCGNKAGLAVIAMEFYEEGVLDFAVQSIISAKLLQIVEG